MIPNIDGFAGKVLGHLRRAENCSIDALAAAIDVDVATIEDFESGLAPLNLSIIQKIARVLNFDPRDFVASVGEYYMSEDRG
ncbi:MAG: helix-turn-helix transcriptional regulator [Pseudomonadota bacterium]